MAIFFNFPPTSRHLHPLQVENCDSNSRLVVDEDDNGKFRLERVKHTFTSQQLQFKELNETDYKLVMGEITVIENEKSVYR